MNTDATIEPDQLIADAIDGAEEMPDPLAGLAEKTAADPGAPFMPEALEALAARAYCGNRDDAVEGVIDADPIATAARAAMATRTVWTGTASDLLGALAEAVGERVAKSRVVPRWPSGAGGPIAPGGGTSAQDRH